MVHVFSLLHKAKLIMLVMTGILISIDVQLTPVQKDQKIQAEHYCYTLYHCLYFILQLSEVKVLIIPIYFRMQHVLQTCPRVIQVKVISSLYGFEQGIGDMIKTI